MAAEATHVHLNPGNSDFVAPCPNQLAAFLLLHMDFRDYVRE